MRPLERVSANALRVPLAGAAGGNAAGGGGTRILDPDANSNVAKVTRMLVEGFGFGWGETVYSGVTFPWSNQACDNW